MVAVSRFFSVEENHSSFKTEVLAGLTTFLAMTYITVINPAILSATGMDFGAVFVATCLAAAFGSITMGVLGNYPIAQAPGMGHAGYGARLGNGARRGFYLRHYFYHHQYLTGSGMVD